jgi:hypothetical protein
MASCGILTNSVPTPQVYTGSQILTTGQLVVDGSPAEGIASVTWRETTSAGTPSSMVMFFGDQSGSGLTEGVLQLYAYPSTGTITPIFSVGPKAAPLFQLTGSQAGRATSATSSFTTATVTITGLTASSIVLWSVYGAVPAGASAALPPVLVQTANTATWTWASATAAFSINYVCLAL